MFSTNELDDFYSHKKRGDEYREEAMSGVVDQQVKNIMLQHPDRIRFNHDEIPDQMYSFSSSKIAKAIYHYSKALEFGTGYATDEWYQSKNQLRRLLFSGDTSKKSKIFEAIKTLPANEAFYLLYPCLNSNKKDRAKDHTKVAQVMWKSKHAGKKFLGEKAKCRLGAGTLKDIENYLASDCFADYHREEMEKKFKKAEQEQIRAKQAKAEYDAKKAARESEHDALIKDYEKIQGEFKRIQRELGKLSARSEYKAKTSVDFSTSVSNAITCAENDETDKPLSQSPPPLPVFEFVERPAVTNQDEQHSHLGKKKEVDQFEVTDEYVMKTPSGKSKFLPDFNLNINLNLFKKTSQPEENKKLKRVPTVSNHSENVVFNKINDKKL